VRISDDRLEKALKYMATTDESAAELKADVERAEYRCKLARAREFVTADGSVEARKAVAEMSESVQQAEDQRCKAIVEFEKVKAKRQTEALIVEVWRTCSANSRQGNV
jgi:hypothetical protein